MSNVHAEISNELPVINDGDAIPETVYAEFEEGGDNGGQH